MILRPQRSTHLLKQLHYTNHILSREGVLIVRDCGGDLFHEGSMGVVRRCGHGGGVAF